MRGRVVAVCVGVGTTACLFPDLSTLSGAMADASPDATSSDVVSHDVTADVTDANGPTDAAWAFVSTKGNYLTDNDGGLTNVSVSSSAAAADLVIVACDSEGAANLITLDAKTAALVPKKVGPFVRTDGALETIVYWGVLTSTPGAFTMTATTLKPVHFLDCSIDVYAGGTASTTLFDNAHTEGTGNSACGPVNTVLGGVAFYVDVAYTCAGIPNAPWTQRQDLEGNPTGDVVPATGASVQANLAACGTGGAWDCLTVSLTP